MGDDLETSLVGSADDTSGDAAGAPTERMVDPQVSPAVPAADDSAERGVATPRRRRRWPIVAPIVVVIVLVVGWVGANAVAAYWIAHNGDTPKLASAPPVGAESVTYAKGRGAWYLAPQPGKPVIVFAHGYQANRGDLVPVARTLHGEGDGAL
ncbi:MAG TPA: hypothetical protein VFC99_00695, partial [Acidimicrobiia bacterium]|nr:hypothetical protein [Acidimicrobiia bacterium]